MVGLTPRQRELLAYLSNRDLCPSYEEMRAAMTWPSKAIVSRAVIQLEKRGYIRRLPNRVRAIEVLKRVPPIIIKGKRYRFIPVHHLPPSGREG